MKKYSLLFFTLLFVSFVSAQKAVIDFEKSNHDFGKIAEEGGKADYDFVFTNKGNAPMVISRVQASCGCTTPTWTKEPIAPGKKGSISVSYNPLGRPGAFTKTITVYSNASEEQVNLIIRGEVIPRASADNSANKLPLNMGDARLSTKVLQMNNIEKGNVQIRSLDIQNAGSSNIRPTVENLPAYITVSVVPEVLKPNETGKINFTYNSKSSTQWGPNTDEAFLVINGQKKYTDEYQIRINSNIIENFAKLTPDQRRKAPILETASKSLDFGVVKFGTKKAAHFKISNKGINPLEIRRIINHNREITIKQPRLSVAGNKLSSLLLELNTQNLPEGDYKKTITLQTNDPDNSFVIVVLNWKVKK